LSEDDLLAARRAALEARLPKPVGKTPHPPAPRTPLEALGARARAMQARLAEAYANKRAGNVRRTSDSRDQPDSARPATGQENKTLPQIRGPDRSDDPAQGWRPMSDQLPLPLPGADQPCPRCQGQGEVYYLRRAVEVIGGKRIPCPVCQGAIRR
jgi:hypothetical protein